MRLLFVLTAFLAAASAHAQTCKYVDKDGRVIYSNITVKNAKKVMCFESPPAPAAAAPAQPDSAASQVRPRVDTTTQRSRDDERRRILESELTAEQERLAQAQQELSAQESVRMGDERNYARVLERLKPYQESVAQHEKNIEALKQELANLR